MKLYNLSRRTLLQGAGAGIAAATFPLHRAFAKDVVVGLVYVGPRDDFGWNQAHAVAAKALKAVSGVKVVEEENVPETVAVAKSMESMINLDGANLIFATSFGYFEPFVVDTAKKFPAVQFRHAAPLWSKDKHPMNAGSYFGYLNQAPLRRRRRRWPVHHLQQDRLRRRQAHPLRAEQRQLGAARRPQDQPEGRRAGGVHGRMVDAGARGRSHQRAGRFGLRYHHLPRGQPQGGDRDRREARRQDLRTQHFAGPAGAQGLHHWCRIQVGDDLQGLRRQSGQGRDAAQLHRRRLPGGHGVTTRRLAPAPAKRRARRRPPPSPTSRPTSRSTSARSRTTRAPWSSTRHTTTKIPSSTA